MISVECRRNSGPYWRHVSVGDLASTPLTGKNNSVGFRTTWYSQFVADHIASTASVPTRIRIASGALSRATSTRPPRRRVTPKTDAIRAERPRVRRERVLAAAEWAMSVAYRVCTERPHGVTWRV